MIQRFTLCDSPEGALYIHAAKITELTIVRLLGSIQFFDEMMGAGCEEAGDDQLKCFDVASCMSLTKAGRVCHRGYRDFLDGLNEPYKGSH